MTLPYILLAHRAEDRIPCVITNGSTRSECMKGCGFEIVGTGHYVPGEPVTNQDLARLMDTSDEWIAKRSGIRQRYFAPEGVGVSDLGVMAAKRALEAANLTPQDIDYVVFATMTPDYVFPGSAGLLSHKLGLRHVPALDIRQQCAAMLYGLQLIHALLQSGAAKTLLFVGAEAHAGFMPWSQWDLLAPGATGEADAEARAHATRHRAVSVLFGDGAGALIFRSTERDAGLQSMQLSCDGSTSHLLYMPGGGFRRRPYWTAQMLENEEQIPQMAGQELFKLAVTKLPEAVRALCVASGYSLDQIDWFLAHQANERINQYVREELAIPAAKMPSNIARFGNTSSATLPILIDELTRGQQLKQGELAALFALGAGGHWGAALLRL